MRARLLLLAGLALSGCGDYTPLSAIPDPSLTLVWSDEFDGPEGSRPDASKWVYDVGGGGWGNRELQYYTDRTDNVRLDGRGVLEIVARAEPFMERSYTSGRLKTQGKFTHRYGRIEARIQIPTGRGIWPAFWALGESIERVGWPTCGEIDVMENNGAQPTIVYGTIHGPGYSGGAALSRSYSVPGGDRLTDDYHVFAVDWSERGIRWLLDGVPYATQLPSNVPAGKEWVYDQPFFLLLNVAVGGNFVGDPDAATRFPQTMRVDYVRAWERAQ